MGRHDVDFRWDQREWLEMATPDESWFSQPKPGSWNDDMLYEGRDVTWVGYPGKMVRVDADMLTSTPENPFYYDHMAYLVEAIKTAPGNLLLEAPAGRVHTVDAGDVEYSQEAYEEGYLEDTGMTRPWEESDIGRTYVHLLDGNHRAFAAIYAGEPFVWMYVGEDYVEYARERGLLQGLRGIVAVLEEDAKGRPTLITVTQDAHASEDEEGIVRELERENSGDQVNGIRFYDDVRKHGPAVTVDWVDWDAYDDEYGLEGPPSKTFTAYHARNGRIDRPTEFRAFRNTDFGPGFYLATEASDVENYGANLHTATVQLENPIVVSNDSIDHELVAWLQKKLGVDDYYLEEHPHPLIGIFDAAKMLFDMDMLTPQKLIAMLQKRGYDGIYIDGTLVNAHHTSLDKLDGDYLVVWEPEQLLTWES